MIVKPDSTALIAVRRTPSVSSAFFLFDGVCLVVFFFVFFFVSAQRQVISYFGQFEHTPKNFLKSFRSPPPPPPVFLSSSL